MGVTQSGQHKPSGASIHKELVAQQTGALPRTKCKFTLNTLPINTEILEKIIIAASQDDMQLLVTPQASCILSSLAQTHITREPQLSMAGDNTPIPI